jgi:hypothetical protein
MDILDKCRKKIEKEKRDMWIRNNQVKKTKRRSICFNVEIACLLLFIFVHPHFSLIFHYSNNIQTIHSSFPLVMHLKSALKSSLPETSTYDKQMRLIYQKIYIVEVVNGLICS